jgi:hypothetical protein
MGLIGDFKRIGRTLMKSINVLGAALAMFPKMIFILVKLVDLIRNIKVLSVLLTFVKLYLFFWACVFWLCWKIIVEYLLHIVILAILSCLSLTCFVLTVTFVVLVSFWDCIVFRGWLYPLYYRFISATENNPDGWLLSNGYHHQNKNERIFGISRFKCPENYIPDSLANSLFCKKMNSDQFAYCPIANIQKQYFYDKMQGRKSLKPFVPNINFMNKSSINKRNIIDTKIKNDQNEMNFCNTYTKNTTPLSKMICGTSDFSIGADTTKLNRICAETFCSNGNWEPFCSKMNISQNINREEIDRINYTFSTTIYQKIYSSVLLIILLTVMSNVIINKFRSTH